MPDSWVTITTGLPGTILPTQAVLEANGIPTFIPDEVVKLMDPALSGANALDRRLLVPARHFDEAARILGLRGQREPFEAGLERDFADAEPTVDELSALATRMGWAALLFPPYTLFLAPRFFRLARGRSTPRSRQLAVAAVVFAIVWLPLATFMLLFTS